MNSIILPSCPRRRSLAIRSGSPTSIGITRKLIRCAFVLMALLAANLSANAEIKSIIIDKLMYEIDTGTKTATVIMHAPERTHNLTIPARITYKSVGYSVTAIGEHAFSYQHDYLTGSLTIPSSVTTIGKCAFSGCSGFTGDLVIPNSVTTIESNAFSGCSGFTGDLVIPNSVTKIYMDAFSGCSGFTGNLVIPNSVTEIGPYAFRSCSGFTGDLVIPYSVIKIDIDAFNGCSGLTGSIIIPNSVVRIKDRAFNGIENIGTVIYKAEKPIEASNNIFSDVVYENAKLEVLESSLELYRTTMPWSLFKDLASSGIEDVAAGEGVTITTRGREIHVAGLEEGAVVTVHDLSGRQVYAGRERVIGPLTGGVYVVVAGGKRQKIKL